MTQKKTDLSDHVPDYGRLRQHKYFYLHIVTLKDVINPAEKLELTRRIYVCIQGTPVRYIYDVFCRPQEPVINLTHFSVDI